MSGTVNWPKARSFTCQWEKPVSSQESSVWTMSSKSLVWLGGETTEKSVSLKHCVHCGCHMAKSPANLIGREVWGTQGQALEAT